MIINGKEIRFRRTVQGQIAVAKLCPGGDPNKLSEVLSGDYIEGQIAAADMMVALSDAYEAARCFNDPEYKRVSITREELLCLDDQKFSDLFVEAFAVWAGEQPTIATKPNGKKKQAGK